MRKGGHHTEETKRKMSKIAKGNQYALGYHLTEEHKRKISEANKGNQYSLGHRHTIKSRYKMSKALKGRCFTKEHLRKMSEAQKGKHFTEETKRKMSEVRKRLWQDPEFAEKQIRVMLKGSYIKPNHAECKLDAILQEICPGEFALNVKANIMVLGGKIPDFVNMNGKKQLIELYGDYWHSKKKTGKDEEIHAQERIDYFRQFGDWDTLIVWEHELKNEAALKQKLQAFAGGKFAMNKEG